MRTSLLNLDPPPANPGGEKSLPSANSTEPIESAAQTVEQSIAETMAQYDSVAAPREIVQRSEIDSADFEIVFGRRQIAGTGLMLMVLLACFSGLSYLIGKAAGSKATAPSTETLATSGLWVAPAQPASTDTVRPPVEPAPVITPGKEGEVSKAPDASKPEVSKPQAPIYASAIPGKVYLQVGAIEKGLAGIWAEGLRVHGLDAFVAPGPSGNIWRVLIGPLPDPQSFQKAKDVLDKLGITTFGKRYGEEPLPH
jgi:cell division septation protein DedD